MYVIGTAGHVDHGKSTLVKALTGIDPDRLQEEKAREMTIDLGFAWLTLPSGREVSVVDVPGHERFIKNMLAGVGGLDAALLVIAADEGPMPQTEEHLAILDLLGVSRGIIVLTKRDMVDEDWLALVEEEVRERVRGTTLSEAPLVPVSARTGEGLDKLRAEIDLLLSETEPRADRGRPRLPVDRTFTIAGFGTVVTGTLTDGTLRVGQEVVVTPGGLKSRVRGLQSHKHKVDSIGPGNRVAVNLVGLEVEDLSRGMVVTTPGWLQPSRRIDIHLNLLADAPGPLKQNDLLDFFTGAAETPARVTLLDKAQLEPGESAWAQLRLRDEVAVAKGDRYIIRRPSPSITIGGGQVVDPHPRRHKRFHEGTIHTLETLQRGTPEELVLEALGAAVMEAKQVAEKSSLEGPQALAAIGKLVEEGRIIDLTAEMRKARESGQNDEEQPSTGNLNPQHLVIDTTAWEEMMRKVTTFLGGFHRAQPLRRGMSKEEVRSRLGQAVMPRAFPYVMGVGVQRGVIAEDATTYRLPDHRPTYTPAQHEQIERMRRAHRENPYSPPSPAEVGIDAEVLAALVEGGELVRVDDGILYSKQAYTEMRERIVQALEAGGEVNVATMRDLFGTTRKYAIPFLEHLDEQKMTRRVGDVRVKW